MADKKLNAFTAAAAWTATCEVVGSDSASPTGSFSWTKAKFDAVYAGLGAANTFTGQNTFTLLPVISNPTNGTGPFAATEFLIRNSSNAGVGSISGGTGVGTLMLVSSNIPAMSIYSSGGNNGIIQIPGGYVFGFAATNAVAGNPDTALARAAAGVVEVNDGTAGTGHGAAVNFPRTAADADAPAPASGATLYSKQVGGKNALFVRFPTGIVQQLAIEL